MAVYHELILRDDLLLDIHKTRINRDYADIENSLRTIDDKDWENTKEFDKPRGPQHITLIHFAAYAGRLKVLKRAEAFGMDLYIADTLRRCALHFAASQGHVDIVRWLVERRVDDYQLRLQDIHGNMALHLAVKAKRVNVVELLIDARVDVNIRDNDGMTPLHLAWINVNRNNPKEMVRYENTVNLLLCSPLFMKFADMPTEASRMMILNCATRLNSSETVKQLLERGVINPRCQYQGTQEITTPLHIAAHHGFHEILCMLLEYRELTSWMINMRNVLGQTPLHVAVSQGQLKCANTLVNNKGNLSSEDKSGLTVIDVLFRYNEHPMAFLMDILDDGVHAIENNKHMVSLNFQVLAPEGKRQMAVVSALIRAVPCMEQMNILQHPLLEVFLGLKWRRLRYSFFILVILQALFVGCLFAYGIVLIQEKGDFPKTRRLLFIWACILFCHNGLKLLMIPKYYSKQFETWLSLICATICVFVTVVGEINPDSMEAATSKDLQQPGHHGRPSSWVLQCISVAILFACIQVMLLFGRFPTWGYYALMFSTVLKNVLKVFLAFVWIIIGFSLSFAVLFHNNDQFNNPWKAFVKTVVMMMGEYEYNDLFSSPDENNSTIINSNSEQGQSTLLSFTSRIIFLVFVMLASIVLMNLMIGLAVTDVQGLLNKGLILRLLKQAEFVTHLEQVTSHWIFRSCLVPRYLTEMLNSKNTIPIEKDLKLSTRPGKHSSHISEELVKKLFDLALKNRNVREKFRVASSCDKNWDSLAKIISYLEKGVEKLQREKKRIQRMQSPECDVETRRRSSTS